MKHPEDLKKTPPDSEADAHDQVKGTVDSDRQRRPERSADPRNQVDGTPMVEVEVAFISIDATMGTPILFLKEKEGG